LKNTTCDLLALNKNPCKIRVRALTRDPTRPGPKLLTRWPGDPWPGDPVPSLACGPVKGCDPRFTLSDVLVINSEVIPDDRYFESAQNSDVFVLNFTRNVDFYNTS